MSEDTPTPERERPLGGATPPPYPEPHHTPPRPPVFRVEGVGHRYPGAAVPALEGIDLAFHPGRITAILGPNGSGKSTLLRILLGALEPTSGEVLWQGRPVASVPRPEMARRVGVVPQGEELAFPIKVRDYVAMGRYPHLGPWRSEGERDREAIRNAMERCGVERFLQRSMNTLSGGEMQRVRIARALAQEPDTLVLDEPTTSLDIRHEMGIFHLLATLAADCQVTVVLVTHNLNLASRYAHALVLLGGGRCAAQGTPGEVLQEELLEAVYGWPVRVVPHPGPGADAGSPQVVPLAHPPTLDPPAPPR